MSDLLLYDTTLRDGCQSEDISFSLKDKLRVAESLAELGIHYIEGGYPGSNPRDAEFFKEVGKLDLAAFGLLEQVAKMSLRRIEAGVGHSPPKTSG